MVDSGWGSKKGESCSEALFQASEPDLAIREQFRFLYVERSCSTLGGFG